MKKLFVMFSILILVSFVSAQETGETPAENAADQNETVKENAEKAQKELNNEVATEKAEAEEEAKEEAEEKAEEKAKEEKEKTEEAQEKIEQMQEYQSQRTFKSEKTEPSQPPVYLEEFKPQKEITKKWYFIPIEISLGTSLQVGLTVAQLTHKNFEIKIARMMLGPGFTFGSSVDDSDRDSFVPGLTFLGEVAIGKFFGNPLKESCFGITLGIGSKVIFDIRNLDDEDRWEDGVNLDDTLYVDFLPIYFTYRWKKGDKFYDLSLRIPLVWQNGVYVVTDETKLYNGVPDLSLNFSFAF